MKTYSKILGILTFLIVTFFLGLVTYFLFFESPNSKDRIGLLITLFPIYIILHFVIIHRFGFSLKAEFSINQKRAILITSLILFGILISISLWQIRETINPKAHENLTEKEIEEWRSKLAKAKTWDNDTTTFGYIGGLKTKCEGFTLYYQLSVRSRRPFNSNIEGFTINFFDKDGFLLNSIEIAEYEASVDKDKMYVIESNSTADILIPTPGESIMDYEEMDYEEIDAWKLLVKMK